MTEMAPAVPVIAGFESPPVAAAEARTSAPLLVSGIEAVARSRLLSVAADAPLVEVAARLSSAQISAAVVPDAAGAPLGTIAEAVLVILKYRALAGKVAAADVVKLDGKTTTTLNGAILKVSTKGGVKLIGDVNLTKTDIAASNGLIHVVESVLMPWA